MILREFLKCLWFTSPAWQKLLGVQVLTALNLMGKYVSVEALNSFNFMYDTNMNSKFSN